LLALFADAGGTTLTGDPDAPAPPSAIDWRRPAGPSETAVQMRRPRRPRFDASEEASSRFEVGRVLQRSFEIVQARWLELLLVTFILVWGIPHLIMLLAYSNVRSSSHDLTTLGLHTIVLLGTNLTRDFGLATVMTSALRGRDAPIFSSILQLLRALPALVPAWLASEFYTAWSLWVSWSGWLRVGSLPLVRLVEIQLAVSGLEMLLVLTAIVAIGVFYPVVIEEGQNALEGISRAWLLMQGARWRFASLFLIYVAMLFAISLPDTWVLAVRASATVRGAAEWLTGGFSATAVALWCVVVVASYVELRSIREGASYLQTAQTFA
jgi:hypothetical protein